MRGKPIDLSGAPGFATTGGLLIQRSAVVVPQVLSIRVDEQSLARF
jgi:hypothetical protein